MPFRRKTVTVTMHPGPDEIEFVADRHKSLDDILISVMNLGPLIRNVRIDLEIEPDKYAEQSL